MKITNIVFIISFLAFVIFSLIFFYGDKSLLGDVTLGIMFSVVILLIIVSKKFNDWFYNR